MDRERLRFQLIEDEGIVKRIYKDHLGNATFGIGHLVTKNDPEYGLPVGTHISEERVWEVFEKDLDTAISEARILFGSQFDSWPAIVQEVLVNMVFQMGRPRVSQFVNMRAALDEKDWVLAAHHGRDSLWYRQTPNRAERLMSRLERA